MPENQSKNGEASDVKSLLARIKELEEALRYSKVKEDEAMKLVVEVHRRNHVYIEENAKLKARNKELEDPDDRHHTSGLGWLGKVVHVIRRIERPLRSNEILHELLAMDKDRDLSSRANPNTYVSVVLTKGVQSGRLKIYKVPGTRGGYYALEEWVDKDGKLNDEMKRQLL